MGSAEETGELERATAAALIQQEPLFPGVDTVSIELGDDHDGDPSMWVVFHLNSGLQADESWFQAFNAYSIKLGLRLIHSGLTRFPYTRLKTAS